MNVVPICKGSNGKAFGSESFGADITGVDLANLTGDSFEAIYRAWLTFGVLRFKDKRLIMTRFRRSASALDHWNKFP